MTVCIETLGLLGLIFAVGFFFYDLKERQDERIARSWQLLTTAAPGNSGKREALEYLNSRSMCISIIDWCWKERTSLTGVDLSRTTHKDRVFLKGVNLFGADLSNAKLDGAILIGANLEGANLQYIVANDIDFAQANLRNSNIESAELKYSNFADADLTNASIQITDVSGSNFTGANLSEASINQVKAMFTTFTNAKLTQVNASYSDFEATAFDNANMSGSSFNFSNFTNAKILNADLTRIKIGGANISGADFNPKSDEIGYLGNPIIWDVNGTIGGSIGDNLLYIWEGEHQPPKAKQFRTTFPELEQEDSFHKVWAYVDNPPTGLSLPLMMKVRFEYPNNRNWLKKKDDAPEFFSFNRPVTRGELTHKTVPDLPVDVWP